jgi:hypothetical protein
MLTGKIYHEKRIISLCKKNVTITFTSVLTISCVSGRGLSWECYVIEGQTFTGIFKF